MQLASAGPLQSPSPAVPGANIGAGGGPDGAALAAHAPTASKQKKRATRSMFLPNPAAMNRK
ncbi:MAG: hypothetical protein C0456_12555 [Hyphomonas sp.]|nr:hypothetical protein [Hyphomonas sp.]